MSNYSLSGKAKSDLDSIADYTIENFGLRQSRIYRDELIACFGSLARNPEIGKNFNSVKTKDIKSFPFKAHTIFYYIEDTNIKILRVLGSKMNFEKHL